jgi:Flp pilus assembly pilin Flp
MAKLCAVFKENAGATVIEYAFVAALISIMIFAGAMSIGTNVSAIFGSVGSSL